MTSVSFGIGSSSPLQYRGFSPRPHHALIRSVAATFAAHSAASDCISAALLRSVRSLLATVSAHGGAGEGEEATAGMSRSFAATAASREMTGSYTTAAGRTAASHRRTPGSCSSSCTLASATRAKYSPPPCASGVSCVSACIAPKGPGVRVAYSSGSALAASWNVAPVSSIASRNCEKQR